MNLGELGKKIISLGAPILGTALAGPAGGTVGRMLAVSLGCESTPAAINARIKDQGPAAVAGLAEFQTRHIEKLEELALARARLKSEQRIAAQRSVNMTMQAESRSEHWPQWSWRPFNGFLFGIAIVAIYFVLPLSDVPVPEVPIEIWVLWGSVLGVTTYGRNQEKRVIAGEPGQGWLQKIIKERFGSVKGK